jgi:hypothetical protein
MRWVTNATSRPLYFRESNPLPNVQKAGWAPVWRDAENFASTSIRSLDRPPRKELRNRLRYPSHHQSQYDFKSVEEKILKIAEVDVRE